MRAMYYCYMSTSRPECDIVDAKGGESGAAYRIRTYDPIITNDSQSLLTRTNPESIEDRARQIIRTLRKSAQNRARKLRL